MKENAYSSVHKTPPRSGPGGFSRCPGSISRVWASLFGGVRADTDADRRPGGARTGARPQQNWTKSRSPRGYDSAGGSSDSKDFQAALELDR